MELKKSLRVLGLVFVLVCVTVPLTVQADRDEYHRSTSYLSHL